VAEKIEITLDGQKYKLRADEDIETIRKAALLVNEQLETIRENTKASSPYQVALLTALNLALRTQTMSTDVTRFKNATSKELKLLMELIEDQVQSVQPPPLGGTA